MPRRIAALPIGKRGFPIPWFVLWVDGEPDFRIMDIQKVPETLKRRLCWICGVPMPKNDIVAFNIGPMSFINRITAEPPSHIECAEWAAKACPFLARPHAKRREKGLPEEVVERAEHMNANPELAIVYMTREFEWWIHKDAFMFNLGDLSRMTVWYEGRKANREEMNHGIDLAIQRLRNVARGNDMRTILKLNDNILMAGVNIKRCWRP